MKCVYGPLKHYYNEACRSWLATNPGKRITIYEIAELLSFAYPLAFTQKNCIAAFKSTGIFPLNKYIFDDDQYLAAEVTNISENDQQLTPNKNSENQRSATPPSQIMPSGSKDISEPVNKTSTSVSTFVSPEVVKPYPKIEQTVTKRGGRKKKRAEELTSTPVMNKLEEEFMEKKRKENLKLKKVQNKGNKKRKPIMELLESSSESEIEMSDIRSSSDDDFCSNIEDHFDCTNILIKSFVLVKFSTKKCVKYFVGQVEKIDMTYKEYSINFLRKVGTKFVFPTVRDEAIVSAEDITIILPPPLENTGKSSRLQTAYRFAMDLTSYNVM